MPSNRHTRQVTPLDQEGLQRLALHYVGRYATTEAKLAAYLNRKLRERGWTGSAVADIDAIVTRCATSGYVDDRAFAQVRAASLGRRGYGPRRVGSALLVAGVEQDIVASVMPDDDEARRSAEIFARRKRIGIYGASAADPKVRQKQIAAMLRAGHSFALAKHFTDALAGAESG